MKKYTFIAFMLTAFLLSGLAKEKTDKKEEKALILETVKAKDVLLEEYLKTANTDSLAALFSPNCHVSFPYQPILESRDSVQAYFKNSIKGGKTYRSFTLTAQELKVYDDIVLEIGTCLERYAKLPLKRLYIEEYHYNIIWKKSKSGDYRIRSAIFTPVQKPTAE